MGPSSSPSAVREFRGEGGVVGCGWAWLGRRLSRAGPKGEQRVYMRNSACTSPSDVRELSQHDDRKKNQITYENLRQKHLELL